MTNYVKNDIQNRFIRMSDNDDTFLAERGLSIKSQIITFYSKRLEITENFYGVENGKGCFSFSCFRAALQAF